METNRLLTVLSINVGIVLSGMTKSGLDPAAYQIVIFDKKNSHIGVPKWIAGSGVAHAAKREPMVTSLTMLGR